MSKLHVGKSKWRKGVYKPLNPQKYKGSNVIIFRSQWEFRVMRQFDMNDNILEWISEQPLIPYMNPNTNTVWNYHPDFLIRAKTPTGIKTILIELKPKKQTIAPVISKGKQQKTILYEAMAWNMNKAKWTAAKAFCDRHGWDFKILTEDDIF
jgi:hypothetical protein